MSAKKKKPGGFVLGVGHDGTDGHKRIAKGDGFAVVGGSAETHERMTEVLMKANEKLARRGENIATADHRRVEDAIREELR